MTSQPRQACRLAAISIYLGVSPLILMTSPSSLAQLPLILGSLILDVSSLPGLWKLSSRGWTLSLYAEVLWGLSRFLEFSVSGVFFSILGMWLMFQVKTHYGRDQ
jgi:hypothetical protein